MHLRPALHGTLSILLKSPVSDRRLRWHGVARPSPRGRGTAVRGDMHPASPEIQKPEFPSNDGGSGIHAGAGERGLCRTCAQLRTSLLSTALALRAASELALAPEPGFSLDPSQPGQLLWAVGAGPGVALPS